MVGAVLIVVGLYSVLWGKHKENKGKKPEAMDIPLAVKGPMKLDEDEPEKTKANNSVADDSMKTNKEEP